MRLATRTFLSTFLPLAALLVGSFWALRLSVMAAVRDDLRHSVRQNQLALANERVRDQFQAARVLGILTENPTLKAGVQLLLTERQDRIEALQTVEDQLREIATSLNFDILAVSSSDGRLLAGIRRVGSNIYPLDLKVANTSNGFFAGFLAEDGRMYQLASGPINQNDENLGQLTVGERFDLARFGTPMVLTRNGHIVDASSKNLNDISLETALTQCSSGAECEIQSHGETYLSLPINSASADGYLLRTLQNVDAAGAPMNVAIWKVFVTAGLVALAAALAISLIGSGSIARPIAAMVERLKATELTGELPEFEVDTVRIHEICELAKGFNRASTAVRGGREQLVHAYVEFTGSLANALDARDPYTAGHSRRVSEYSCAIARIVGLSEPQLDDLRIGALLHDIGKIGISDSILLKPGRLTGEEEALIRQHPVIGRRILEGVQGFHAYLDVVELHHENWDGTGYPHGLKAEQTPLAARIVKVADAFDAMTSDRPYRSGMTHESAVHILERGAGTQFDETIVRAFARLPLGIRSLVSASVPHAVSLRKLSDAITGREPAPIVLEDA
jgi:HD-GYP domain-containing protein (c-di-GMP phosphodiesterase class II)